MTIEITLVNRSRYIKDSVVNSWIPAFQAYLDEDVCPAWGFDKVEMHFIPRKGEMPKTTWPLYIMDKSDDADALGYHEDDNGRINGRVFAWDCIHFGASLTVDATHEICEMLGDPSTEVMVDLPDGKRCFRELCDACEDEAQAYYKNGVMVSDFCLPSYFNFGVGPWDFTKHLKGPAPMLASGGYLGIFDPATGQYTQIAARTRHGALSMRSRRTGRTHYRSLMGPPKA